MNYYNEFDPKAAAWLRELIAMGSIPRGEVDERSIADVTPGDLRGFVQCHFFAGVGGWSLALERAGVPGDRPLWTGSCPCQCYSCAGTGQGVEDPRDLWPRFFGLIRECRPVRVFGEQVEAAIGHGWLDRLSADMEAEGYAVGAAVLGAHSAGADHQRQRLYWVADAHGGNASTEREQRGGQQRQQPQDGSPVEWLADTKSADGRGEQQAGGTRGRRSGLAGSGDAGGMADSQHAERRPVDVAGEDGRDGQDGGREEAHGQPGACGEVCDVADAAPRGLGADGGTPGPAGHAEQRDEAGGMVYAFGERGCGGPAGRENAGHARESGQTGNFWSGAVAIPCRDNCFRRAEPGIFPLVARLPRGVVPSGDPRVPGYADATSEARVMRLKGYGNAINVETARMFIQACEETLK